MQEANTKGHILCDSTEIKLPERVEIESGLVATRSWGWRWGGKETERWEGLLKKEKIVCQVLVEARGIRS